MPRRKIPECDLLEVNLNGKKGFAERRQYEIKKLAQLKEFGYPDLTLQEVVEQVDAVLEKKKFGEGLTVIGMFMEGEVIALKKAPGS